MTVQVSADNSVARRLKTLARLYQQGQASEVMDRTLDKLLSYEREQSKAQLGELQVDLAELERRYQMSSADFYRRFRAGKTDDRMDYVEWASLIQMADNLQERLQVLAGEKRQHFPGIPGFPHHIHDGPEDRVSPGQPTNIFIVLDEIIQRQSSPLES